jgi:hypothetical protein
MYLWSHQPGFHCRILINQCFRFGCRRAQYENACQISFIGEGTGHDHLAGIKQGGNTVAMLQENFISILGFHRLPLRPLPENGHLELDQLVILGEGGG